MDSKGNWSDILNVINRPLGFFALALLIAESSLAVVLIFSNLTESHKYIGMWLIFSLFVFLVITVAALAWFKPKALIYSEEGHLRDRFDFGTEENPIRAEARFSGEKKEEGKG